MIWLSAANLKGAINLLHEKKPNKLVRECKSREGEPQISSAAHLF